MHRVIWILAWRRCPKVHFTNVSAHFILFLFFFLYCSWFLIMFILFLTIVCQISVYLLELNGSKIMSNSCTRDKTNVTFILFIKIKGYTFMEGNSVKIVFTPSSLKGKNLLLFRLDPFTKCAWRSGMQTGSNRCCLPWQKSIKWQKYSNYCHHWLR